MPSTIDKLILNPERQHFGTGSPYEEPKHCRRYEPKTVTGAAESPNRVMKSKKKSTLVPAGIESLTTNFQGERVHPSNEGIERLCRWNEGIYFRKLTT